MDQLTVSLGKNRRAKSWNVDYPSWEEFAARLQVFEEKEVTPEEYHKMTPMQKADVKDGPAFVGGFIKGNRRTKDSVESRSLITLDADSIKSLDDFLFDAEMFLADLNYVMYSTLSHRPNRPRLRIVIPMDQEVDADKHEAVARKVAGLIGIEYFDRTTFDVNRLMYLPTKLKGADTLFMRGEGQVLEVDHILGMYDDWTDWSEWDRHPDEEQKLSHMRQKKGDPLEKQGAIGVFNRTYSISEAIDTFLSDKYEQCDVKDRYTFAGGSTAAGLVIYDNDTFATSNHSTDPISGQTVNAYDLVRIHKYGGMDEGTDNKGKIGKMPSDKAMKRLIDNDKGCKRTYRHENGVNAISREFADEEFSEEFAAQKAEIKAAMAETTAGEEHDPEAWADELTMEDGEFLLTARNIELILSCGPMEGVIAYNDFSNSYVMRKPAPWITDKDTLDRFEREGSIPWTSKEDSRLRHFILGNYRVRAKELIQDAFINIALENRFHPIKEYIESVEWDGKKRAESIFIDMVGAEDSHYTRQVTRKILLAAVTRLYEAGAKFDQMVVLYGGQGIGKSTILERLAVKDSWFNSNLTSFESKHAGEHLQAGWIFEIGELSAMNKSDTEEIKAFLSKRADKYRPAYASTVEEFPRRSVFFGTTNDDSFLRDQTGNRRFWIIPTYQMPKGQTLWDKLKGDAGDAYMHQLWAEVFTWYIDMEDLLIDDEAREAAEEMQNDFVQDNPLAEELRVWINTPRPVDEWEDDEAEELINAVCIKNVWHEFMGKEDKVIPWGSKREITTALQVIFKHDPDWTYKRVKVGKYGQQRAYVRE